MRFMSKPPSGGAGRRVEATERSSEEVYAAFRYVTDARAKSSAGRRTDEKRREHRDQRCETEPASSFLSVCAA
jgi:hypothetical protein